MKWIAYQSDESGSNQVYVLPFPGPGAKRQVSTSGGTFPRWNRSGRVIYFIEGGKVMSAEVNGSGSTFEIGNVRIWFDPAPMGGTNIRDISDDGQKILLEVPRSRQTLTPMSLVVNWDKELRGRKDEGKQE
jgi:hypothetical protein